MIHIITAHQQQPISTNFQLVTSVKAMQKVIPGMFFAAFKLKNNALI